MKIAAYQAPLLDCGSFDAVELFIPHVAGSEGQGVETLCCPEEILSRLANNERSPFDMELDVDSAELEGLLAPLLRETVSIAIGFTEFLDDLLWLVLLALHESPPYPLRAVRLA